jgi:hypothetical protein
MSEINITGKAKISINITPSNKGRDQDREAYFLASTLLWYLDPKLLEKTMGVIVKHTLRSMIEEKVVEMLKNSEEGEPVMVINYPDGNRMVADLEDTYKLLYEDDVLELEDELDDLDDGLPNE